MQKSNAFNVVCADGLKLHLPLPSCKLARLHPLPHPSSLRCGGGGAGVNPVASSPRWRHRSRRGALEREGRCLRKRHRSRRGHAGGPRHTEEDRQAKGRGRSGRVDKIRDSGAKKRRVNYTLGHILLPKFHFGPHYTYLFTLD